MQTSHTYYVPSTCKGKPDEVNSTVYLKKFLSPFSVELEQAVNRNCTIKVLVMKVVVLFCLLSTVLSFPDKKTLRRPQIPGFNGNSEGTKIVGGSDAPAHSQPHQVSLQYRGANGWTHFCGGSIIGPTKVVTAGHCVEAINGNFASFRAAAGEHDLSVEDGAEQVSVLKTGLYHPNYDLETIDWDYGVLTLETPFQFNSNVQPIPLAESGVEPSGVCLTSGWGYTAPGSNLPNVLQLVSLPIVSREACAEIYSDILWGITDRMVCAGGEFGYSVCSGDSGGPLVCNGTAGAYLAGITSYTMDPCGYTKYPSGWANVALARDWILSN